jgi:hypothetical protein
MRPERTVELLGLRVWAAAANEQAVASGLLRVGCIGAGWPEAARCQALWPGLQPPDGLPGPVQPSLFEAT